MFETSHEQRLIDDEYCGDDALLQKAMSEYSSGSSSSLIRGQRGQEYLEKVLWIVTTLAMPSLRESKAHAQR
jgi:hypothetical protein